MVFLVRTLLGVVARIGLGEFEEEGEFADVMGGRQKSKCWRSDSFRRHPPYPATA